MKNNTTLSHSDQGRRQLLNQRQDTIQNEVWRRLRGGRTNRPTDVGDDVELCDADIQGDLEVAQLQMKADELARVNEALRRFDAGQYGSCVECGEAISSGRLQAVPFAVRCRECEEIREQAQGRTRLATQPGRLGPLSRRLDP